MTVAIKDPIAKAASLAAEVDCSRIDETKVEIERLRERKDALDRKEVGLLGIERAAFDSVRAEAQHVIDLSEKKKQEIAQMEFHRDTGLLRLSEEPLTWTKDGMPLIVPFSLDQNFTSIIVDQWGKWTISPDRVRFLVAPLWKLSLPAARPSHSDHYTARFKGVLPASVREKARKWSQPLFVFSEVDEWTVHEEAIPTYDPLLVLKHHGCLWLLDKFDATPIEEYISEEFTS